MTNEEEASDLAVVAKFDKELKELCQRHGVFVETSMSGYSRVYILVGSSKPGLKRDIHLVYSGRL